MNDRKQHVINTAHQLFISKGFQATSIQDILDYSGISKGTFYNYFSSKNELLIGLFTSLTKKLEKERNQLLHGNDSRDVEIFIRQLELHLEMNKENNLFALYDEVIALNDKELREYFRQNQLQILQWIYSRFLDIYGEKKQPFLFDSAIMFFAILNFFLKFYGRAFNFTKTGIRQIILYAMHRMNAIVEEVSQSDEVIFPPDLLNEWLPNQNFDHHILNRASSSFSLLKEIIKGNGSPQKYFELLDFIQEELLNSQNPRYFLLSSALQSLKSYKALSPQWVIELENLKILIEEYFEEEKEGH